MSTIILLNFCMCPWKCWETLTHTHAHTLQSLHHDQIVTIEEKLRVTLLTIRGRSAFSLELWFLGLRVGIFLLGKTQVTGKTGHDFFFFFFMRTWPQLFRDWENSYLPLKYACLLRHHLGIVPAGKGQKHLCSGSLSDFSRGEEQICSFVFLTNLSFQNMWLVSISIMWFPNIHMLL